MWESARRRSGLGGQGRAGAGRQAAEAPALRLGHVRIPPDAPHAGQVGKGGGGGHKVAEHRGVQGAVDPGCWESRERLTEGLD